MLDNIYEEPAPAMTLDAPPSPEQSNHSFDVASHFVADGSGNSQAASDEQSTLTAQQVVQWVQSREKHVRRCKDQFKREQKEKLVQAERTKETLDGQTPENFKRVYQGAFAALETELQCANDKLEEMQKQIEALMTERDTLSAQLNTQKQEEDERVETRVQERLEEARSAFCDAAVNAYDRVVKRPRAI